MPVPASARTGIRYTCIYFMLGDVGLPEELVPELPVPEESDPLEVPALLDAGAVEEESVAAPVLDDEPDVPVSEDAPEDPVPADEPDDPVSDEAPEVLIPDDEPDDPMSDEVPDEPASR